VATRPERFLVLVHNPPSAAPHEPLGGNRRPGDATAQLLQPIPLLGLAERVSVQRKPGARPAEVLAASDYDVLLRSAAEILALRPDMGLLAALPLRVPR